MSVTNDIVLFQKESVQRERIKTAMAVLPDKLRSLIEVPSRFEKGGFVLTFSQVMRTCVHQATEANLDAVTGETLSV